MRTDGRMDRRDRANCRFSQFLERSNKIKKQWACGRDIKQSIRHGILRDWVKGFVTKFWPAVCLFIVAYNLFALGLSGPNFGI